MTEQNDVAIQNVAVVEKFLYALRDKDLGGMDELLDPDVLYQNVGFSSMRGSARVIKLMAPLKKRPSMGFDVQFHRSAVDGSTVLNERTDVLAFGPVRLQFWVCGVFEVHDGRITLWRDYFDAFDFTKAIIRVLVGAVVPALRPKFSA